MKERDLFIEALQRPGPAERAAYLERACAGDPALRRRIDLDVGKIAVIDTFTSVQLDLALGRSNVIHAALLAGRESETFLARVERLGRFRTGGLGDRNGPNRAEKPEKQDRNG